MQTGLELIARLTDDDESAKEFSEVEGSIKELCEDLSALKHIPEICDGV